MKILLLTVGLTLVCGLQALDNNAEDSPTITGDWYTIALASNVTSKIDEGGSLQMFIKNVKEKNGNIQGNFFKRVKGVCSPFTMTASKGADGHMHVKYDGENVFDIKTLDSKYAILILYNTKGKKGTVWGELFGRTPNVSDEIMEEFQEKCEEAGIRKDQIRDLSNDDRCEILR